MGGKTSSEACTWAACCDIASHPPPLQNRRVPDEEDRKAIYSGMVAIMRAQSLRRFLELMEEFCKL